MKTTTKKRVGTLGLVFALCLSTLATFSFFTDREQQTTGGTAGTFDLVFEDISASKSGDNGIQSENEFAIDQVWENKSLVSEGGVLNPGDFFDLSYTIANEGSKSMDVKQLLTLNSTVELTEGAEEYKLTISRAGETETITGTLADDKMSISYEIPEIVLNGSVEIEDGVDITEQTYIVRLDFDLMAENTFQSSVVTINYNAQAKQHRNTDTSHWTNWADLETGVEQFAKPQLSKPEISLDGDTLTITPVENATGYEIYNGGTLLTTTTETSVDLSGLISDPGTYTVKVRATGSSDYMPSGYAKVEYVRELTPGLYQTGSNYTVLIKSWDDMISDGWITEDGKVVSRMTGYLAGDLMIPDTITEIVAQSYHMCSSLTGAMIPDGVTVINASAFESTGLTSVTFGENSQLTTIDSNTFNGSGLTSIKIPASVTSIGTNAFSDCRKLVSMTVDSENTVYHGDGNCIIETASKTLVAGCKNSVIPADGTVTTIGAKAFYYCTSLKSIEIPASVTTIGNDAFYYCTSLTNVSFAEDSRLTSIGGFAFQNCTSLASIEIPASVTTIDTYAFQGCTSLANVTFAEGSKLTTIGNDAFYYCTSLKSIEIPASVTTIGNAAFASTPAMTSMSVASGNTVYHSAGNCIIETASKTLVAGCKNSVIPADGSVTSIGESAFYGYTNLESIQIPASVTTIGKNAFSGCSALVNVFYAGTEEQWSAISIHATGNNYLTSATINYNYTAE